VNDTDPVKPAMEEIGRSTPEAAGPNPFAAAAADQVHAVLQPATLNSVEVELPPVPQMAGLPRDRAIHLRWSLRDIYARRTKLSPVSQEDLAMLLEMGLVEMRDDGPGLTPKGHQAIE
jgi:predicted component of type VI protein secretion system